MNPQAMEALAKGNANRLRYCRAKEEISSMDKPEAVALCADLLENPDPYQGMKLGDLLGAIPAWGKHRAERVAQTVGYDRLTRIGDMTDRRRAALARFLRGQGGMFTDKHGFIHEQAAA